MINFSRYAVLVVFLAVFPSGAFCETIELKNGKKIVGDIVAQTEDAVVVSKQNGSFVYSISRDRVKLIRSSTPEEIEKEKAVERGTFRVVIKPKEKEQIDRREKIKEYRLAAYEDEVLAAKKARGRVKINFVEGKPGVVEALLNGKEKALLRVDTGASMVVISSAVASRLGYDLAAGKRIYATLADGSIVKAIQVTLDSVKVGSSSAKGIKAAVIDNCVSESDIDGLLGMSFLGYFDVKLDSDKNCLYLEKY